MTSSPLWRGGGRMFPNSPDENFCHKLNKKMYRAGMAAILSQLARDGRLAVVDSLTVDAPKTKLLAAKLKAMGLDSVLVIADTVDENLGSPRATWPTCWSSSRATPIRCRWSSTRRCWSPRARSSSSRRCSHEHASLPSPRIDESRLAQVLVAPIVSEKATRVGEKHNQVLFKVLRDATKPEIKAAVELMFKVEVECRCRWSTQKGKAKRFGRSIGRRDHVKKAYVSLKPGQELNFSGEAA